MKNRILGFAFLGLALGSLFANGAEPSEELQALIQQDRCVRDAMANGAAFAGKSMEEILEYARSQRCE